MFLSVRKTDIPKDFSLFTDLKQGITSYSASEDG